MMLWSEQVACSSYINLVFRGQYAIKWCVLEVIIHHPGFLRGHIKGLQVHFRMLDPIVGKQGFVSLLYHIYIEHNKYQPKKWQLDCVYYVDGKIYMECMWTSFT